MQKIICSAQVRLPQKTLKAILLSSMLVGLLLPLSALSAEEEETPSADNKMFVEVPSPSDNPSVNEPTDSGTEQITASLLDTGMTNNDVKDNDVEINDKIPSTTTELPISDENPSVTSALDNVQNRASSETPKATTVTQAVADKKSADKQPSWMNMEYLLGAGLLLLLLGGGLLLLSKINELKNDNKHLADNNARLKHKSDEQTQLAISAKRENEKLKADIIRLNTLDEPLTDAVDIDNELSSAWLVETPELVIIDDLNKSDRRQLASIFENWLRTNRGNTDVRDSIPESIQRKLKDSQYVIEFWGQSDGLDAVEITKNTTRTAVISLIKHDHQGYAYCYKKPNSMSALWKNKAWYDVEKVNGMLKITGESLETT